MTSPPRPTKADLAAAVERLTAENAALRDLIAAAQQNAALPDPADVNEPEWGRYLGAALNRLIDLQIWLKDPGDVHEIARNARHIRERTARPLKYAPKAAPADVLATCPGCGEADGCRCADAIAAPQCPAGLLRDGEDWGAACQHDAGHEPPHDGQDGEWTDDHPRHLPSLDAHKFPAPGAPAQDKGALLECGCKVPGLEALPPGHPVFCVPCQDDSAIAARDDEPMPDGYLPLRTPLPPGGMVVRNGVEYAAPAGGAA